MAIKKKFPYKAAFVACNGGCRAKDCRYGCIGCGACENLCPARPFSAIYVEGHEVHRKI